MQIINGKKIADEILVLIKNEVARLPFKPIFCDVLVGEDLSSLQYVKMKANIARSVGIEFQNAFFPASITTEELIKEIYILNNIENMCGIIIQLPLPVHIDRQAILDAISPKLDVDCLGKIMSEKFYSGGSADEMGFPTALACMTMLDSLQIDLVKLKIVVLGQGILVGRPVTALLKFRNISPVAITSQTPDKEKIIKEADIIISAIGKAKYLTGEMIKQGVIVIDAGASELDGSVVGDVDLESVKNVASYISPVPGGVGPVTVAMLLNNVLTVAKSKPHP